MARATWRADLLASFAERDAREKSQAAFIIEYSRLADRAASLTSTSATAATSPPSHPDVVGETNTNATAVTTTTTELQTLHSELTTIRTNLASSQKDRTDLQTKLAQATTHLAQLQKSSSANFRELDKVKMERYQLEQKVKQKEDELKVNRKIIENLQDEVLALNIQLDVADQTKARLKKENEDLIARWMAKKKDEAEAMNNNSRYS